jgi:hypothetical protein
MSGENYSIRRVARDECRAARFMTTASTPSIAASRRPWYRLHLSTWLVAVLGLLVGVLLIVPGEDGVYPEDGSLRPERAVVHGWPWPYLWRTPATISSYQPMTTSSPWWLCTAVRSLNGFALIADTLLCTCVCAIAVSIFELQRRRTRRLQYSLRSLLLFVTLIALALGWWGLERARNIELHEHLAGYWGKTPHYSEVIVPRFPLWVRDAIGEPSLLELGINRPADGRDYEWSPARQQHIQYLIHRCPQLFVTLKRPRDDDLDGFFQLAGVRRLIVNGAPPSFFGRISRLANLEVMFADDLDDDALIRLGQIAGL